MRLTVSYTMRARALNSSELEYHLREYLKVMADEPAEELIKVSDVYHHLRRILGDE